MLLTEVILRLRACCPSFERRVGGTASFSVNTQPSAQFAVPHCFVVPTTVEAEQATGNGTSTKLTEKFLTIVAVDNSVRREDGQISAYDQVETLRREIRNALIGWEPVMWANTKPALIGFGPGDEDLIPNSRLDTFRFLGGQHLSMNTQRLWHSWEWETSFQDAPPKSDTLRGFREVRLTPVQPVALGKGLTIGRVTSPSGEVYSIEEYSYNSETGTIRRTTNSAIPANSNVIVWFEQPAPLFSKLFAAYFPDVLEKAGGDPANITREMYDLLSDIPPGTPIVQTPVLPGDEHSPAAVRGYNLAVKET